MKLIQKILQIHIIIFLISTNMIMAGNVDTSKTVPEETFTKIGGHTFSVISFIENPFIVHSLQVNLGVASTMAKDIPISLDDIGLDTIFAKSEMSYLMGGIGYKHKINDWAAISVDINAMGRISSSFATILFRGISTISGFSLKWHIKILQTKKSLLTTSLALNNYSYYYINVYKFLKDVIDTIDNKPPSLDQSYSALGTILGLSYALGCTDFFGIITTGHFGYGEIPSKNFNNGYFGDFEFYLDFNFTNLIDVPIDLSIGTKLDTFPFEIDNPKDISTSSFLKIAYVGNKYINLGLESGYMIIPEYQVTKPDTEPLPIQTDEIITNKIFSTHFVLKLFF